MGEEKKIPSWVAITTSLIGFVGVVATAYFGYLQNKPDASNALRSNSVPTEEKLAVVKPEVEYSLGKYSGAHLKIGNTLEKGIIVISDLTLHWNYLKCPRYRPPTVGAALIEYRYEVTVTKKRDSKLLDDREFKYGPGEVDAFYVDIHYPDLGVYQIWAEFKYRNLGATDINIYQTQKASIELCEK